MSKSVLTSIEDGVATLRLNRPEAMNSFDADTARMIRDAVEAFGADEAVRVLIVGGEGPAFSAGGGFHWGPGWPALDAIPRPAPSHALMGAVPAVFPFPQPA